MHIKLNGLRTFDSGKLDNTWQICDWSIDKGASRPPFISAGCIGQWSVIAYFFFLGYRDCVLCVDATYIYCWVLFLIVESTPKGSKSNTVPFFSLVMMKLLYESKTCVINQCTFVLLESCQYNCSADEGWYKSFFLFLLQPRSLFYTWNVQISKGSSYQYLYGICALN